MQFLLQRLKKQTRFLPNLVNNSLRADDKCHLLTWFKLLARSILRCLWLFFTRLKCGQSARNWTMVFRAAPAAISLHQIPRPQWHTTEELLCECFSRPGSRHSLDLCAGRFFPAFSSAADQHDPGHCLIFCAL